MKNKNVERYRKKYPEKQKARWITQSKIQRGKLKRGDCEVCNKINAEAHHLDYKNPDKIKWLCRQCHRKEHTNICICSKCDKKHHAKGLCRYHYRITYPEKWHKSRFLKKQIN